MSDKDELTGALRRDAFIPFLSAEIGKSSVTNMPFFLMCANIDNMKRFNMHNGYLLGDKLLANFVELANSQFDRRFPISRYGGDWFVSIFNEVTIEEAGHLTSGLCDKVRASLSPTQVEHCGDKHCLGPTKVSVSIGVAVWTKGKTVESLFREAEDSLYKAKITSRGKVCISV